MTGTGSRSRNTTGVACAATLCPNSSIIAGNSESLNVRFVVSLMLIVTM